MRKVRIFEHISLDGIIEPAEGADEYRHGGWTAPFRSPEGAALTAESQGNGYDLLLGRRTYDLWAGYWPKMKGGPFADGINGATKYVVTHRPDSLEWGPVGKLGADVIEGVRALKATDGPDLIVWGSTTVTRILFEQGFVDEVVLDVYPVILGAGKRPFSEKAGLHEFTFVRSKATPSGVLVNTYRRIE